MAWVLRSSHTMQLEMERVRRQVRGDRLLRRGGFRVERQLGQGGMCTVFEVVNDALGTRKAMKVLSPALLQEGEIVARFRDEARALARLQHPGLVRIDDLGALPDGTPYILMELLRGESLAQRLGRGPLLPRDALRIAAQLADTLRAVHAAGVIHRDLKPGNVMLAADEDGVEQAKILDFGVAKLLGQGDLPGGETAVCTIAGALMGTPTYMSPEQIQGAAQVDGQTDVYALGALLFSMLAGRPPFLAPRIDQLLELQVRAPAPRLRALCPEIGEDAAALVHLLLEKAPAARPTMAEAAWRLREVLRTLPEPEEAEVIVESAPDAETLQAVQRLAAPAQRSAMQSQTLVVRGRRPRTFEPGALDVLLLFVGVLLMLG